MTKARILLTELQQEAKATRKILGNVPFVNPDWKPHEKSMPLRSLATHVAEIPGWFESILIDDELDFAKYKYEPAVPKTTAELVKHFDENLTKAKQILESFPDDKMSDMWTMRQGETIFFTLPKEVVARSWCMNHLYHHRAQLGVYLRLLDVPVPVTYGSSADYQ